MLLQKVCQKLLVTTINYLIYLFKSRFFLVKGVGYVKGPLLGVKFSQQKHRLVVRNEARYFVMQGFDMRKVAFVHRYDVVKASKIVARQFASSVRKAEAVLSSIAASALVGKLANVVGVGSCRVAVKSVGMAGFVRQLPKGSFGNGRAANVSCTNK